MPSQTDQQATACAQSAPGLFGLDDISMLIGVISLAFQAWKLCHGSPAAPSSPAALSQGAHTAACRCVRRAARKHGKHLEPDQVSALTDHMLTHLASTPASVVSACYYEPSPPLEESLSDDE